MSRKGPYEFLASLIRPTFTAEGDQVLATTTKFIGCQPATRLARCPASPFCSSFSQLGTRRAYNLRFPQIKVMQFQSDWMKMYHNEFCNVHGHGEFHMLPQCRRPAGTTVAYSFII